MKTNLLAIFSFAALLFTSCDSTTDGLGVSLTSSMDNLSISTDTLKFKIDLKEFDNVVVEPFYKVHFERYAVYWPISY